MTKTSTFQFTVNNLASKIEKDVVRLDDAFDFEENYAEVFEVLDNLSTDAPQDVVNSIIKYASRKK